MHMCTRRHTHTRTLSKEMNAPAGKQPEHRGATQNLHCANCFCRLHLAAHSVGAQSVTEGQWRAKALFKTRNNNVKPRCLDEGRKCQVLSTIQQTDNKTTVAWCRTTFESKTLQCLISSELIGKTRRAPIEQCQRQTHLGREGLIGKTKC